MKRTLWIVTFACALIVFACASAFSVASWIEHRHIPALGWILLASDSLVCWIALGYLRFRLHDAHSEAAAQTLGAREGLGNLADMSGAGAAAAAHDLHASAAPLHG